MSNLETLNQDLLYISNMFDQTFANGLAERKCLSEKLNSSKFDEVIHELFAKDEIIKFLSSSGIQVAMTADKDLLTEAVQKAVYIFQYHVLNQLHGDIDLTDAQEQELKDILSKHVKFDEDGEIHSDSDPEIVERITSCFEGTEVGISHEFRAADGEGLAIITSNCIAYRTVDIIHAASFTYCGETTVIETKLDCEAFKEWAAEHFLVKDVGEGMASFELLY